MMTITLDTKARLERRNLSEKSILTVKISDYENLARKENNLLFFLSIISFSTEL